jgi:PAS domain S-box-containing protein
MKMSAVRILLAEDDPSDAAHLQEMLRQAAPGRFEFARVARLDQALACLRREAFDALLLDLSLPDSSGPDAFIRARSAAPHLPIVALTGAENESLGLAAVRHGVQDYVVKGRADGPQVVRTIRYAIERQLNEKALWAERDFVSAVLDTEGALVVVLDRQGRILRFNRACEELTGYSAAEMRGRVFWESLVPPEDLPVVREVWAALHSGSAHHTHEHRWLTKDGSRRLIAWSTSTLPGESGEFHYVVGTGIDITERKQAEQAVRDREEELAAIYENAPVVMMLVDGERRVHKANKQAEMFTGTGATDLLGRRAGEALCCLHAGDDPRGCGFGPHCRQCALRRTITGTFETGRSQQQLEVTLLVVANGEPREATFLLSTLRLSVRGQLRTLVTMQDITLRKRAEEALQRAHGELELRVAERTAQLRALAAELTQSEERERRRIARILHDDLQQLLVGARLRLEALRVRPDSKALEGDLRRIEKLLNESSDVARGLSHEMSPAVLHEHGLVAGLRWLGGWMREKQGLGVRVSAVGAADPLPQEIKVLLFQSVRELLFNVVKHAGVNRATVRVGQGPGGWIEILVSDKGRGFDCRPARTSPKVPAGFGLFGIRERLTFLGGRMEVDSQPGQGCRIRLIAPPGEPVRTRVPSAPKNRLIRAASARRKNGAAASRRAPAKDSPRTKIRVLLADDHKVMRDGLATYLEERSGIEVVGLASDGQEAIGLAAKLQPDVVIMDIGLPRLEGIEATRRLVATWPHIKVIGLTMHADKSTHDAMCAAGAVDCLLKSGPTHDLIRAINKAAAPISPE